MQIRLAVEDDVSGLSTLLQGLAAAGKRTLPSDEDFVRQRYVAHPDNAACHVAVDQDGTLLGLQVLMRAGEGNDYGVTPGWGIIGTHVGLHAARSGVGKALFAQTVAAAAVAKLPKIDATMGAENPEALGYYAAMGFQSYRSAPGTVSKVYDLGAAADAEAGSESGAK